ncbi:MAG: acyl-CoA thioesterase [Firmicutes bacterium]|nr:acyl-CoA thioesterase [Bacillota bacterium]
MKSEIIIEPRYAETDQMGIIHHSVYPVWYEMARVKFCFDIGLPFQHIEQRGVGLVMVHMALTYLKPARFGEFVRIETRLTEFSKVRMTFKYEVYNDANEMINQGETKLVWLGKDLKPLNIYKDHADIYELFKKQLEE